MEWVFDEWGFLWMSYYWREWLHISLSVIKKSEKGKNTVIMNDLYFFFVIYWSCIQLWNVFGIVLKRIKDLLSYDEWFWWLSLFLSHSQSLVADYHVLIHRFIELVVTHSFPSIPKHQCLEHYGSVMSRITGQRTTYVRWCEMRVWLIVSVVWLLEGLVSIKLMRDRQTNEPQGTFNEASVNSYRLWIYWFCNWRGCY